MQQESILKRLEGILHRVDSLTRERDALLHAIAQAENRAQTLEAKNKALQQQLAEQEGHYRMLRLAKALPEGDTQRRDLKLKINEYLRMIDQTLAGLGS